MGSPRTHAPRTLTSRTIPVLTLAAVLTVSGCAIPGLPGPTGAPAVEQAAALTPQSEDPQAAEAAPAVAARPVIVGEIADGAASHTLGAAENELVIDYWTTDNTASWTPKSSPIIRLSARVAGSTAGKAIKITRFSARVDSLNAVLANDTGDFAIDSPHSYSSAIVVPGNTASLSTRIVFTFDLLTETAPGAGVFTRQTVMDQLTLEYAGPVPPASAPADAKE
ncbi:MAG: hypothetical protein JWQ75_2595 [Pseudarthrobacter sp.]|nr:hypothetical protein [Pseudarthrobacter sp.]